MFKNLLPDRNYTLSVSMRNGVGEGPPATTLVSTPPEPTGTRTVSNLYLIILMGVFKYVI
jgi:proto-oncogene tyrosine-protein kinase ROS